MSRAGWTTSRRPLFRGVNADLNMTLAMAMIFFVCWIVWALQATASADSSCTFSGPKGASRWPGR